MTNPIKTNTFILLYILFYYYIYSSRIISEGSFKKYFFLVFSLDVID